MTLQQTLAVGTELIDDFRIIDLLGSGGFANTYLAMDLTLGREVAIKEFFPSELAIRANSQSVSVKGPAQKVQFNWAMGRFVREAKTLAKFRHPSVVRVFRVFNANDTAYIVLEFVRGSNMDMWLKRIQRRPSQDELDHFLPPLLDALEVVHDAGILHRDIKPANIYIREDERTPVLLDFGAAKYAASTVGDQTATTAAIVSKGYSPHEAYSTDAKLQGPWTDIYGLAATLHRGLTGSAPMESTTRIMEDDFVPLANRTELASRYRTDFLSSIDHALAVMPKDRPQSIAQWRRELYPTVAPAGVSTSQASANTGGAIWQPLSDTPSDATTLYTGGNSRPSQAISVGRGGSSSISQTASKSPSSTITEATRLAYDRVVGARSRATLTGWALALAGTAGLAAPLLLNLASGPDADTTPAEITVARAPDGDTATGIAPAKVDIPSATGKQVPSQEDAAAQAALDADRTAAMEREQKAELQRKEWERQRWALQADMARRRAEEASKLAERRAAERKAREQETERKRLADLEQEKQRQAEQQRLAAEKAAQEKAAAEQAAREKAAADERERQRVAQEKAVAEERERQKIAAEKAAEEERKRIAAEEAAENERQRLAAEQKDREAREAAEQAAREQERLRLVREAERAERERNKREAANAPQREREYAALNPVVPNPVEPATVPVDRKAELVKVQTALKEEKCYSGDIDGDLDATQTAVSKFSDSYKGTAQKINLASASSKDYESWIFWFRSLKDNGCAPAPVRKQIARPDPKDDVEISPRRKKTYKPRSSTKKKSVSKPKATRSRTRTTKKRSRSRSSSSRRASRPTYGAGSTGNSLLRGTR